MPFLGSARKLLYILYSIAAMKLAEHLKSFLSKRKITWNGVDIADRQSQNVISSITDEKFISKFLTQTGIDLREVNTFVSSAAGCSNDDSLLANGHPLEYDNDVFGLNESAENSKLVDIATAQLIISCFLQLDKELILKSLPMLIFCDGTSNRNSIYLLYLCLKAKETSFKQSKSDKEHALTIKSVSCKGPSPVETWKTLDCQKHAFKLAFPYHMLLQDGSLPPNSVVTMKSFQQHELFSLTSLSQSFDQLPNASSISVDVSCNKVHSLFATDSANISSVTVNITPIPGDSRSPTYAIFKDLMILEGVLNGFGESGEVKWAEQEYDSDCEAPRNLIVDKLKNVFTSFYDFSASQIPDEKNGDEDEIASFITSREELDFTEKCWDVLKLVQSFQELLDGLALVMNEIEQKNAGQFWLHENSKSVLAKWIKNSYENNFQKPCLTDLLPIQILLEIGMEKLKRDYKHLFTSNCLCTAARLDELLSVKAENDVGKRLKLEFAALSKVHHTLALAAYAHTFLQLPMAVIRKIVKSTLQDYSSCDVDFNRTFSFSVSYNEVKVQLETSSPFLWKINVTGSNENGKCHGSSCWTTDFPFDEFIHSSSSESNLEKFTSDSDELESSVHYYMTSVTESFVPLTT